MPTKKKEPKITIVKDGPFLVTGGLHLSKEVIEIDKDGIPSKWKNLGKIPVKCDYALCRCGESKNKPFCDGSHSTCGFDGTEVAGLKTDPNDVSKINGPDLILRDEGSLCVGAGFCHRYGGTWNLTKASDIPRAKKEAIKEACNCPGGRLTAIDKKTKYAIERDIKPELSITYHPEGEISGPIWVKGGVPIESSDGKTYQEKNRRCLCRCGKSFNKPFCDGTHISIGFDDS